MEKSESCNFIMKKDGLCRYESAEMFWRLHDCGVPTKHLLYPGLSHADFVIAWRPLQQRRHTRQSSLEISALRGAVKRGMPRNASSQTDFEDDLTAVLSEVAAVRYERM